MRACLQRVSQASVSIRGEKKDEIGQGLVVLLGVTETDTEAEAEYLVDKCVNLRIFEDENGKFNRSVKDVGGALLIVSQFTLYADCSKGRRPSLGKAAPPETSEPLYEKFVELAEATGLKIATGVFGEQMAINLTNDGPVTLTLEKES